MWPLDVSDLPGALAGPGGRARPADDSGDHDEQADQDAVLDELLEARDRGEVTTLSAGEVAGRVAEELPAGPGLAALLTQIPAAEHRDDDLPAIAAGFRRLAAWAQWGELAAVAQIASRAAAAEEKIGVDAAGRPARVSPSAAGEVALALAMTQAGAAGWTDLAVTLAWRLAATGAALAAGEIDLYRARLIAEATSLLSDAKARAVEVRVLPAAGQLTTSQLRAALRRAVIAVDPEGADERRREAERQARVTLFPEQDGTASLSGTSLPAVRAAAAMARIGAIARAWKASGAGGGSDLLRAEVFLGLLLGTLPYIPPAEGAPPGEPPGCDPRPGDPSADGPPAGRPPSGDPPPDQPPPGDPPVTKPPGGEPSAAGQSRPSGDASDDPGPGDEDAPEQDGLDELDPPPCPGADDAGLEDDRLAASPAPPWPHIPALLPDAVTAPANGTPGRGLLDLTLPWATLTGISAAPATLGWIGPISGTEARRLAAAAAASRAVEWRVIVVSASGHALAVARVPRRRSGCGPPGTAASLVGRVTVVMPEPSADQPWPGLAPHAEPDWPRGSPLPMAAVLRAALRGLTRAREHAAADAAAGGCAHLPAARGYRPSPSLREYVVARDQTCRSPGCRRPAWRGDLDHTVPYECGGETCACNLGGLCRTHHRLKQMAGWRLRQLRPGVFEWSTPAGRRYEQAPDAYAS